MCRVCLGPERLARPLPFYASGTPRSPAAAPAPLAPPGVAGQHGPGRGAAKDRQEAGEDGGQEEDGEAAEFGLQPPLPTPGQARGVRAPRSPGGACWPGAREARAGLGDPREARLGLGSAPRGGRLASQGGRVRGPGAPGVRWGGWCCGSTELAPEDPKASCARPSGPAGLGALG